MLFVLLNLSVKDALEYYTLVLYIRRMTYCARLLIAVLKAAIWVKK